MAVQKALAQEVVTEVSVQPAHEPARLYRDEPAATPKGGPRNIFLPTTETAFGWRTTFLGL